MTAPGVTPRERILLTGKTGQLGWELERTLAPLGEVVAFARTELDLGQPDALRRAVRDVRPTVIVNAAAYTAVDAAEEDESTAHAVNGVAPGVLAEEARTLGALLVHYSTDYVFSGGKGVFSGGRGVFSGGKGGSSGGGGGTPYTETDPTDPESAYGRTKRDGERAVAAVGGAHLVFRTSWVYSLRGKNFLLTMARFFAAGRQLRVVDDQFGTPTWSRLLAEATAQVLAARCFGAGPADSDARRTALEEISGLYHLGANGETSWYGFAQAIIDRLAARAVAVGEARPANADVTPIPGSEFPQAAKRPPYGVLSKARFESVFDLRLPPWEEQLDLCLDDAPFEVHSP